MHVPSRPTLAAILICVALTLAACATDPTPTAIPAAPPPETPVPPSPTPLPSPTVATPSEPSPTHRPSDAPATEPSPTMPAAEPTTVPQIRIDGPLLIDSNAGRLYTRGALDDVPHTLVLDAATGALIASTAITGSLGLDATSQRLYIDRLADGLSIVDAITLEPLAAVDLPLPPHAEEHRTTHVPPLADETQDHALAFRGHRLYRVDSATAQIVDQVDFADWQRIGSDGPIADLHPMIEAAHYDPTRDVLYLQYMSYSQVPWQGQAIVTCELRNNEVIGTTGDTQPRPLAHEGCLYGTSNHRFGIGYRWKRCLDGDLFYSEHWSGGSPGFTLDTRRHRLYESTLTDKGMPRLRVFDAETMALLRVAILPDPTYGCELAGYDPAGDRLYLLSFDGKLRILPVDEIPEPTPEPHQPAEPPDSTVRALHVADDGALYGLWEKSQPTQGYVTVFNQSGGLLYVSRDGGQTWRRSDGGLRGESPLVSALAVGHETPQGRALLAGIVGAGVFRSDDGGQLWHPSSLGMESMAVRELLVVPSFARDQTLFAHTLATLRNEPGTPPRSLYRSSDGGQSWHPLPLDADVVAISPEFDVDGALLALGRTQAGDAPGLYRSSDRGDSWDRLPDPPDVEHLAHLTMAPLYAQWQVAFAYSRHGILYRTADGGLTWTQVLQTLNEQCQLVVAPNIVENRPVYLLTYPAPRSTKETNTVYRSLDGGQTFEPLILPRGLSATALAISPTYDQDGLIYLGTTEGRVLTLRGLTLPARRGQ